MFFKKKLAIKNNNKIIIQTINVYFNPSPAIWFLNFGKLLALITIDFAIPKFSKNDNDKKIWKKI